MRPTDETKYKQAGTRVTADVRDYTKRVLGFAHCFFIDTQGAWDRVECYDSILAHAESVDLQRKRDCQTATRREVTCKKNTDHYLDQLELPRFEFRLGLLCTGKHQRHATAVRTMREMCERSSSSGKTTTHHQQRRTCAVRTAYSSRSLSESYWCAGRLAICHDGKRCQKGLTDALGQLRLAPMNWTTTAAAPSAKMFYKSGPNVQLSLRIPWRFPRGWFFRMAQTMCANCGSECWIRLWLPACPQYSMTMLEFFAGTPVDGREELPRYSPRQDIAPMGQSCTSARFFHSI